MRFASTLIVSILTGVIIGDRQIGVFVVELNWNVCLTGPVKISLPIKSSWKVELRSSRNEREIVLLRMLYSLLTTVFTEVLVLSTLYEEPKYAARTLILSGQLAGDACGHKSASCCLHYRFESQEFVVWHVVQILFRIFR